MPIDKIQSVMQRLLKFMVYDDARAARYDHTRLRSMADVIEDGRKALAGDPAVAAWLDDEIAAGKGSDPSIILYTSGTTGTSKGVVLSNERSIHAATDTATFDKLNENDVALAYLRSLGRRPLSQLRTRVGIRVLHGLQTRGPVCGKSARLLFCATAHTRIVADAVRCRFIERRLLPLLH